MDGAPANSATGVYVYMPMAGALFALAAVTAIMLVRNQHVAPIVDAPQHLTA